jgi:hypothetical protein
MKKIKKVYMPKWIAWFILIMMLPMLILVEYEAFFGKEPYPTMGIVTGFMLILVVVMMFLISYRKLPYFYIEG